MSSSGCHQNINSVTNINGTITMTRWLGSLTWYLSKCFLENFPTGDLILNSNIFWKKKDILLFAQFEVTFSNTFLKNFACRIGIQSNYWYFQRTMIQKLRPRIYLSFWEGQSQSGRSWFMGFNWTIQTTESGPSNLRYKHSLVRTPLDRVHNFLVFIGPGEFRPECFKLMWS